MTRFLLVLVAALAAAPAALADGIAPFAVQGGPGVLAPGGGSRYVAVGGGAATTVVRIDARGGGVLGSATVAGTWGVPVVTYASDAEGVSLDGRTLVLGDVVRSWPHRRSSFLFLDPRSLRVRDRVTLRGDFSFDALSPDASRLYLIQHVDANDTTRYVVRALDTRTLRLLPGRIADRTQKGWVMEGYPLSRAISKDGRWVYTLYSNPQNVPFVHALDTERGVAHCVGLPARGDATRWTLRLHGGTLAAGPWRVDTSTWRVAPAGGGGVPWWAWAALAVAGAAGTAAAVRFRRARRSRLVRVFAAVVLALAAAPAALADGPMPYALQNGPGVLSPGGLLRYVAVAGDRNSTTVEAVATHGGTVHAFVQLLGAYGLPYTASPADPEGLSTDGRTLVLGDVSYSSPRTHSAFAILDAPRLRVRDVFSLKGDFAYDALSPDGSRLYLIQHVSASDQSRYVVRAYDVRTQRLLPGRVADRTQKSWVMQGSPVARTTSADGRWVYTLYSNGGDYPFVHALDTVRGVAHCVGLPWRGDPDGVWNMRLALHGSSLAVHFASGRPWVKVDTAGWQVSPDRRGGPPWWAWAALALAAATIVGAYAGRTRALAAGAAGRDRSPARLGSWLPLTPMRFGAASTSSSRSWRGRISGATSSARPGSRRSTSAHSGSSSATTGS